LDAEAALIVVPPGIAMSPIVPGDGELEHAQSEQAKLTGKGVD